MQIPEFIYQSIAPGIVGYYDDCLYSMTQVASGDWKWQQADDTFKPRILIIARQHYDEYLSEYAISDKAELQKVLALKREAEPESVHLIRYSTTVGYGVSEWRLHISSEQLVNAQFWIPESLLLAEVTESGQLMALDSNWYFYNRKNAPVSLMNGGLLQSIDLFKESAGVSPDIEHIKITQSEHSRLIHLACRQFNWLLLSCFNLVSKTQSSTNWYRWGVITTILVILYLGLSSLYINMHLNEVNNALEKNQAVLSEVMSLRHQANLNNEAIESLGSSVNSRSQTFQVWEVLLPLIDSGMRMSNFRYQDGRFIVTAIHPVATDVLKALSQNNLVIEPRFESPVSVVRGGERLVVSFALSVQLEITDG